MKKLKCLLLSSVLVLSGTSLAADLPNPPPLEGRKLENVLDDWAWALSTFLESQGKTTTVTFGVAPLSITDSNSSEYLTSVDLAFQAALVQAYVKIAQSKDPGGIDNVASSQQEQSMQSSNIARQRAIDQCTKEAEIIYARHQAEQAEAQKKRDSLFSLIKDRLKTAERRAEDEERARMNRDSPNDFVHTCEIVGDVDRLSASSGTLITDTISGGRIHGTFLHEGEVGVVVWINNETSAIANSLRAQLPPAQALQSAKQELRARIEEDLELQQGDLIGVLGARMARLSNGEWAVYGFGAGQVKQSSSIMAGLANDSARNAAAEKSRASLNRFAALMIDANTSIEQIRDAKITYTININLTQGTQNVTEDPSFVIGELVKSALNTEARINLRGSEPILSRNLESEDFEYYVAATAWSPSIMANNMGERSDWDSAGLESTLEEAPDAEGKGKDSKVRILSRDW